MQQREKKTQLEEKNVRSASQRAHFCDAPLITALGGGLAWIVNKDGVPGRRDLWSPSFKMKTVLIQNCPDAGRRRSGHVL